MVQAFCPGHITCFFRPAGGKDEPILSRGSLGAGIRISLGATVEVIERSGRGLHVVMDGETVSAPVTESVFRQLSPDRGYDVTVENDLPCSQGFGMSAAGAIASAICLADLLDLPYEKSFEAAHIAEIEGGGGLGDVSAIYCLAHQPVRVKQGLPPRGEVIGTEVKFPTLSLAALGPKMHTGNVLGEKSVYDAIVSAGDTAVSEYLRSPTAESLFRLSNEFSGTAGVECTTVSMAIGTVHGTGYSAAMCMLGNSIFSDMPADELEEALDGAQVFTCTSTDASPRIIRKG